MSVLQLVGEEEIPEDNLQEYFEDLYRIVCVSERPAGPTTEAGLVRSTYIVDWEQLVHLLEDYECFGEDIVEVSRMPGHEAHTLQRTFGSSRVARA